MSTIPHSTTLVFLGRSGCGKDTQLEFLLKREDLRSAIQVSVGALFRKLSRRESIIGRKVRHILDVGGLHPMWLASSMWISSIDEELHEGDILLLDGTPRRLAEAELLDDVLGFMDRPRAVAIYLDISPEESMRRLLLRKRADDTEERIKSRLEWFTTSVVPVIEYYRNEGRLIEVDGMLPVSDVAASLAEKLDSYFTDAS